MATALQNHAAHRTVVLLRPSEKKRLERLARQENVSSSEIIRRSLQAYDSPSTQKEQEMKILIAEMNQALDAALQSIRSARAEVAENLAQIKQRQAK